MRSDTNGLSIYSFLALLECFTNGQSDRSAHRIEMARREGDGRCVHLEPIGAGRTY
jgi:hypothetical protein